MPKDEKKGDKMATSAKAVEELPGVGPATAEKLREAGYTDLMSIAVASPDMIAEATEIGSSSAQKIVAAARDAVDVGSFDSRGWGVGCYHPECDVGGCLRVCLLRKFQN